mmetsp:Transcript_944/g.2990  ORF Transcript_944/g.2990 Transcript_944/m.2990 type:complete len:219 (+) Transcript_944:471-1127(+)
MCFNRSCQALRLILRLSPTMAGDRGPPAPSNFELHHLRPSPPHVPKRRRVVQSPIAGLAAIQQLDLVLVHCRVGHTEEAKLLLPECTLGAARPDHRAWMVVAVHYLHEVTLVRSPAHLSEDFKVGIVVELDRVMSHPYTALRQAPRDTQLKDRRPRRSFGGSEQVLLHVSIPQRLKFVQACLLVSHSDKLPVFNSHTQLVGIKDPSTKIAEPTKDGEE